MAMLEILLIVKTVEMGRFAAGIYWIEAVKAAKFPTVHRTTPGQRMIHPKVLECCSR
jgi:hypothetical protein